MVEDRDPAQGAGMIESQHQPVERRIDPGHAPEGG